ncbi:M81 family metallopeptidase [Falsigemmobacter faecalis]|uniref:Microcystinase C n=1 Tax=Falsigemmobacter faecalis TaxID=2488730 RepID=A0A3P3DG39_9RHOB|nr:M81 family metallopeptidase [Falsigemmobacter faecalis]RRH72804.1 M81 family peptidase [Falsigemmobacter faecalis]
MRLLIAQVNHETNTFSPLPTLLAAFRPVYGAEALAAARGKQTPVGAFLDWAERRGFEVTCPILAHAFPSGPVADAAFEQICDAILSALDDSIDMVLLDLHGAMVTRSHEDGEGELIARIRRRRPDVPIGVALDLHAHVTGALAGSVQAICGYLSYPHIDMYETGERVCEAMELRGRLGDLTLCHLALPLIAHSLPMNSERPGVMRDMLDAVASLAEETGLVDVSLFGGFPASDIREAGMSLVALAEPGHDPAPALEKIADAIWARRAEFIYDQKPLEASLDDAGAALALPGEGPVLLLDHGDNCMSGGTCDNIDVLKAVLQAGFTGVVAGPFHDPAVVAAAFAAGEGAEITVGLGNKIPAEHFAPPGPPLILTARVERLGAGDYTVTGPIYTGMLCQMGRVALLSTPEAKILVAETPHEPWDRGIFTSVGVIPEEARVLLLKSRMYCRPVFEPLSKAVVEVAGGGVTGSDFSLFDFKNLRRPIYPLDADASRKTHDDPRTP